MSATEGVRARLAGIQAQVEAELERRLPPVEGRAAKLHEAVRYSALGGGKRVRPALAYLAAEAAGADPTRALAAGCAVEMIHVYSLVHDDLPAMDDDDLRRGRPTNHKVYGEATAILVGDGLQPLAFSTLVDAYGEDPALTVDLVRLLAEAAGVRGMVAGQAMDMAATGGADERTVEALEALHRNKTGALLRAPVLMGARIAGVTPSDPRWAALDGYSRALGLAFQVADDVLDCTASTEVLGKTAGKDAEQEKLTYVALLGLEGARAKAADCEREAVAHLDGLGEAAEPLRELARFVVHRES